MNLGKFFCKTEDNKLRLDLKALFSATDAEFMKHFTAKITDGPIVEFKATDKPGYMYYRIGTTWGSFVYDKKNRILHAYRMEHGRKWEFIVAYQEV